ncbi:hypothetical protein [Nonomuraea sp. NPDC050783]|uniref:hypothetical protein n=1 Tax=Nonomuraea sp. NPDC050783 TaxID=3154634 RepID=UPI00346728E4
MALWIIGQVSPPEPSHPYVVVQLALVLATILLPDRFRLWPPTCGFGPWDEAHRFWLAMPAVPYGWLALACRDLRR